MRTPRTVSIDITSRCNARCLYCYHFDNDGVSYRDLPTAEWLQFFDELGSLKVMDVTLAGGEPLIREDLPELIDGIVANGMRFSILSNGALLTDRLAAYLARSGRCDGVQISVDGSRPETHDAVRGEGSFAASLRAISLLQQHGLRVNCRMTIHHFNVDDLEATAELLLERLGLPEFSTNSAGYLGSCRVNADQLMLTTQERQAAMESLVRLTERYPGRIRAAAGPLADVRMWSRMEAARRAGEPPFDNGGRLTACGCPFSELAVRADGTIVICSLMPTLELGRVNRDSLQAVWLEHPLLIQHRRRQSIALRDFESCSACGYVDYCTGNCPASAFTLCGATDAPNPDSCLSAFLADGGTLVDGGTW